MLSTDPETGRPVFYIDHSLISTFDSCNEKGNLGYNLSLTRKSEFLPFTFGSAIHAGVAVLTVGGSYEQAASAFVKECKEKNSVIPLSIEDNEKRSVERGLAILEAYQERWKNDPYTVLRSPDGKPYVEIGFRLHLFSWRDIPVMLCGIMDAVVKNENDNGVYVKETKTTAQSLSQFVQRTKPNHQVTIYDYAAKEVLYTSIDGTIWDGIFVSSRQPKKDGDHWLRKGVDIEKDFIRQRTSRTQGDIDDMLEDVKEVAINYLTLIDSGRKRWRRNTAQCHSYGGCDFLDACIARQNAQVLSSMYVRKEWKPWEGREFSL